MDRYELFVYFTEPNEFETGRKRENCWKIIFDRKLHWNIVNSEESFISRFVEHRNLFVLKMLLENRRKWKPNLRDTGSSGNTLLHHLCGTPLKNVEDDESSKLYSSCIPLIVYWTEHEHLNTFNKKKKTPMDLAIEQVSSQMIHIILIVFSFQDNKEAISLLLSYSMTWNLSESAYKRLRDRPKLLGGALSQQQKKRLSKNIPRFTNLRYDIFSQNTTRFCLFNQFNIPQNDFFQ